MIRYPFVRLTSIQGLSMCKTSISNQTKVISVKNNYFKNIKRYQTTWQSTQTFETDKYSYYTPVDGRVRTSPYDPLVIPDVTLDKYIFDDFYKWQKHIATECVVTGRKYTYAQLRDHSAALAIKLQKNFKLELADVVAICLPNLPEYPIALFASIEGGFITSTVNPCYTAEEIGRQLTASNAKLLFGTATNYKTLKEACNIAKKDLPIICIRTSNNDTLPDGGIDFFELINPHQIYFKQLIQHNFNKEDLLFLPFSSGTTGLPKGVMLSHRNIISNCEMIQSKSPFPLIVHEATENSQEVIPCLLPFFHIYGLVVTLISNLKLGCQLVTIPKFTPDDLIKTLVDYKGSLFHLVPPIVLFLTNHPKLTPKTTENMKTIMSGAAPIGQLDVEKFLAKFPNVDFIQGYGLTETSPVVMMAPLKCKNYAAAGFLTAGTEGKILDLQDEKRIGLGPNQIGEICVRGPQVMKGYLNNEKATKEILDENNWLRTGDVGYYDEQGYFYITERIKELIKVKGFQVPPAELEELLRDYPKILDAAVVGVSHPVHGEVPRAFVVLRPNTEATEDEIKEYIADKVIAYKKLEGGVTFLTDIPKTVSGKILRRELKLKYC